MKVSLVQMNSQGDKAANLAAASEMIRSTVAAERPDLVVLPEYFAFLSDVPAEMHESGDTLPDGEVHAMLSALARELGVTIHAGSIVERAGNSYHNTTLVFDPKGEQIARYRKMHLFDVETPNGVAYKESDSVAPGDEVVTYRVGDATVGCAICYDIRFPELFRALRDKGADIIVLPAAFTLSTGKDHWEVLARARAIETQTYFLAVGQTGTHAEGRKACWGHSMVIDPWGHVVAQCSDGVGTTSARIDPAYTAKVRTSIPVAQHHVL